MAHFDSIVSVPLLRMDRKLPNARDQLFLLLRRQSLNRCEEEFIRAFTLEIEVEGLWLSFNVRNIEILTRTFMIGVLIVLHQH